ncbi:DUF2784 domain-containing protein [Trichloromonas sp.]|uniref:DUF2784 domain-containing protein n=1 Tax=Trichloromonas sp. TaxID=3069249 RepID=UPI002A393C37|nr:DUF2784 domain-containing protein [Trichloromonas sp.]
MLYTLLAKVTLLSHLGFILFVLFGALAVRRRPWLAWLHLPAGVWGTLVELTGWFCPLTDLENHCRRLAGEAGYTGSCIDHYLTALIYPDGLSRPLQILLGLGVLVLNLWLYAGLIRARRRESP